jgi:hypothetical protein
VGVIFSENGWTCPISTPTPIPTHSQPYPQPHPHPHSHTHTNNHTHTHTHTPNLQLKHREQEQQQRLFSNEFFPVKKIIYVYPSQFFSYVIWMDFNFQGRDNL